MSTNLLGAESTNFWDSIINWCTTTGLQILTKLIVALLIWWVSFRVINFVFKKLDKKMTEKKVDRTIKDSIVGFGRKGLKLLVFIIIIGYLGVEMSSIVALITSIGVTVGLALQGSLSNFAGGIIILIMRPFRIGDFVEYDGESGTVEKIQLFYTTIVTGDNKVIVVPNSKVTNTTVTNYSIKDVRRVDFTFSIAYENDFRKAKRILHKLVDNHEMVLADKGITIRVGAHNASSIDIICRAWTKSADYWDFKFDILEKVKYEFDKNGISIPYNQLDVHIKEDDKLPKPIDEDDVLVKEEIEFENQEYTAKKKKKAEELEKQKAEEEKEEQKVSSKIKKVIGIKK